MEKSLLIFFLIFGKIFSIYCQEDTTETVLEAYQLKNNYSDYIQTHIDSGLNDLHIYNPIFKNDISFSYTGNLASPYMNDVFYKRDLASDFYLLTPYRHYYVEQENITYYNTNKPYTNISYITNMGDKDVSEHDVSVLHTQNFGTLNVGFKIHHLGGKGHYDRQSTTNGNGSFFTHYDGLHYELFANANIINFLIEQNGGIDDSSFMEDILPLPFLNAAETEIKSRSFMITQKYRFGVKVDTLENSKSYIGALAHTISYKTIKRSFSDILNERDDSEYYDTAFYYNTFDTSYYRNITNQFRFEIYESEESLFSVHGHVGLEMENMSQFSTTSDTVGSFIPGKELRTTNLSLIWNLGQDKKHYYWNVNGGYYFSGYKQFDIDFNSSISFRVLDYELSGYYNFKNAEPDFFFKKYESNHYSWDNGFNKMQVNDLGAILINKKHKLKAQVNNRLATGLIYFNTEALPSQAGKVANVLSIEAEKTFQFGKFVLKGKGIYQQTNATNFLAVPEWTFYSSAYVDYIIHFKLTGGDLAFQFGTDIYYKSKFYGYEYNPVFEQFYLQKEVEIGGYPYLSPFLNIKIKRVRFFIKYDHVNDLFMNRKDYFSLVNYPRDPNNIKFGLFWHFYD